MFRHAPRPRTPAEVAAVIPHERIARRAYENWCRRGCTHGHDMQDWLEAEAELRTAAVPAAREQAHRQR